MEGKTEKLGLFHCTMLLIGAMIGSAIFSLSGLTMYLAGPAALLSWGIAGVIELMYGLFMVELSCIFPKSGGVYVFPRLAYSEKNGKRLGWIACWCAMLTNVIAVAFSAIYVGMYLSVSFPSLSKLQIPIAIASILLCLVANVIRFSTTGKINTVIVLILLGTMLVYIAFAFCSGNYDFGKLSPFFTQGSQGQWGFVSALPIAIIGYSGVISIAFLVSEVRKPERTVPVSTMIAIAVVIVVYALMILATMGLVTVQYFADNEKMRFIPIFAACFTKMSEISWLAKVVTVSTVLALLTTMLVCVSMNARAIQAAADDKCLPECLGRTVQNGEPVMAAGITCIFAAILACFPKLTMNIVNLGAILNIITICITTLALTKARKCNSGKKSAFKAPGGFVMPYIVVVILALCNLPEIISGGNKIWLFTAILLALGMLLRYCVSLSRTEKRQ